MDNDFFDSMKTMDIRFDICIRCGNCTWTLECNHCFEEFCMKCMRAHLLLNPQMIANNMHEEDS